MNAIQNAGKYNSQLDDGGIGSRYREAEKLTL